MQVRLLSGLLMYISYKAVLFIADELNRSLRHDDSRLKRVSIEHEDGSKFFYESALIERLDDWVIILSEHHRPVVYNVGDLREFVEKEYE